MHPTLIEIFDLKITTYGFMVAIAFATMWLLTLNRGKKLGYSEDFIQNLIMFIVLGAFVFARLVHVVATWDYYAQHPWDILFSREGFVFLGGFIGGVLVGVWYSWMKKQSILGMADLFAPYLALAQGIGRIGSFLYGCCYGAVCQLPWGTRFPEDSPAFYKHWSEGWISGDALYSLPVHPTQIYHSLFNFVHFGILIWIRNRQTFKGQVGLAYVMIYSLGRFIIEFYRADNRGELFGVFSTSQEISVILFVVAMALYLWLRNKAWQPDRVLPVETVEEQLSKAKN